MQAIETKYLGPTNTRGARVKAACEAGSVTMSWDYGLNTEGNHDAALEALVTKLGWFGVWTRGGKADGTGNVYVRISKPDSMRTPAPIAVSPLTYVVVHPAEGEGKR